MVASYDTQSGNEVVPVYITNPRHHTRARGAGPI